MKQNMLGFACAFATIALFAGVTTASGCGTSAAALCDDICACQRCTSNDSTACHDSADASETKAFDSGCGSQFSDLTDCAKKHISCKGDSAIVEGCEAEQAALAKCSNGSIPFLGADACELAATHLSVCLGSTGSSGSGSTKVQCDGQSLCAAGCINAADCASIKDAFSGMPTAASKPFIDCASKCASSQ